MNNPPAAITINKTRLSPRVFSILLFSLSTVPLVLGSSAPNRSQPTGTCPQYTITPGTDSIVPGFTDIGNHTDDGDTLVTLPFAFQLYDQTYITVNVNSNGRLDFVTVNEPGGFTTNCLPAPPNVGPYDFTIFALWHDLRTDPGFAGCNNFPGGFCGILKTTEGTAPDRIFSLEWRAVRFDNTAQTVNFEVRLYENPASGKRFDIIYGNLNGITNNVTAGVQGNSAAGFFTQDFCNIAPPQNVSRTYTGGPCGTPTPTPTCTPGWPAGPDLPMALIRSVGVFFPADSSFYLLGGRTSDAAGSDFQHVLRWQPTTNTWTQMGVTLPDNQVNNMACAVLATPGNPLIYCVGGSAATQTTATARVFTYNPVTDTATTLSATDNWPGNPSGTILPGGFAWNNNKLYIIGGFDINVASTNQIWEFDHTVVAASKWTQKANAPMGIMFAPTSSIGDTIYVAGASDFSGGTVIDTTNSFSFIPSTNTIGTIAAIPRATGETRAVTFNGQMWVLGGGRIAPNPSNEVDIYDPGTNTWTTGVPFTNARRNLAADSDGFTRIYLAGGYGTDGVPISSMEFFCGNSLPKALNISTRMRVQTGNNVLIGGLIVTGNDPKMVAVRGIGPSLGAFGVPDFLADPTLELHASNGDLLMQNDNWQDDPNQAQQLIDANLALTNPLESGMVTTLPSNAAYTAILAGKNGGTGIGLVEVYDLNSLASSQLANISTRGFVLNGNDVMIGGFILHGNGTAQVAVRGIGPSIPGLSPLLADPTLELHDSNGALLVANDNWQDDPTSALQLTAHGLAPPDTHESGIFTTLAPGTFTAILAGKNGGTGIGLVEIYNVQ